MWKCYFENLKTGVVFTKIFDSEYKKNQFMIKCRYSKKIKALGCSKCSDLLWE